MKQEPVPVFSGGSWIEVRAESNSPLQIGEQVKVLKVSSSSFIVAD